MPQQSEYLQWPFFNLFSFIPIYNINVLLIVVYYLLHATRIFASNLKEKMAQRFYNLVLLPRVRDDLAEYKRLNFHLYQALRKALFKPGAFMKGILLPLLEVSAYYLLESNLYFML